MVTPSNPELIQARDEFHYLLGRPTREQDWQRFFSQRPFVLSMALPLRLEPADLVPLGRPGRTEPDFLFYPKNTVPVPYYGVIELKRPTSTVVTLTRENAAILSRDAETAIQQISAYTTDIAKYAPTVLSGAPVFLGNRAHMFVIMGLSRDLSQKLSTDIYRSMVAKRLPENLQLLPYDTLLQLFESRLPPRCYFLMPEAAVQTDTREDLVIRIQETWAIVYGIAKRFGERNREGLARSAHGYRPEWLIRTWLPEKYKGMDEGIPAGMKDAARDDLEDLLHVLEDALVQAKLRE